MRAESSKRTPPISPSRRLVRLFDFHFLGIASLFPLLSFLTSFGLFFPVSTSPCRKKLHDEASTDSQTTHQHADAPTKQDTDAPAHQLINTPTQRKENSQNKHASAPFVLAGHTITTRWSH